MSEITTIGLDLAKHVFQVHGNRKLDQNLGGTRASGEQPAISTSLENEALNSHLLGLASAGQFTAESIAALLKDFGEG